MGSERLSLQDIAGIASELPGVIRRDGEGLPQWRVRGRLVARALDEDHLVIRCPFEQRAVLLEASPRTFCVPTRFAKHMMVVADLQRGDPALIEDALVNAWHLQADERLRARLRR